MASHINEKYKAHLDPIIRDINNGLRVLIMLRGLPGSGKSTLARNIIAATVGSGEYPHILSTDDYFVVNGVYKYDVSKLSDAHIWNQRRADQYLNQGISPIIIDNTNCEAWEMRPYAVCGVSNGYIIKILEPGNTWSFNPSKLAQMNSHGVGFIKIKKMMEKYQRNVTVDYLLKQFEIRYPSHYNSPVLRSAPPIPQQGVKNQTPKNGFVQASTSSSAPANKLNPAINASSSSGNFDTIIDLIDLTEPDDWVIAENPNNYLGCDKNTSVTKNTQERNILDGDDPWEGTWSNNTKNTPKPQRVSNKTSLVKLNDNSSTGYNWEPIDVSLSTWDYQSLGHMSISQNTTSANNKIEHCEVATNTSGFDVNSDNHDQFKILSGRNRNINSSNVSLPNIPKARFTLDKGVMTTEENINQESDEQSRAESMNHLKALFHDVPEDYMLDILNKCNGDLNWTVEILLDAKNESDFTDLSEFATPAVVKENTVIDIEEYENKTPKNLPKNDSKPTKVLKKDKNPSEYSVELKKKIEEQFQFSDDHYSKHSLELKRKIHGECSSSHMNDFAEEQESPQRRSNSESSDEPDNTVSFRMGRDFFSQLDKIYGMDIAWDDKLEPIIHIPESLVNQIHALWLESVCNQIDVYKENMKVMMCEDEELAR